MVEDHEICQGGFWLLKQTNPKNPKMSTNPPAPLKGCGNSLLNSCQFDDPSKSGFESFCLGQANNGEGGNSVQNASHLIIHTVYLKKSG